MCLDPFRLPSLSHSFYWSEFIASVRNEEKSLGNASQQIGRNTDSCWDLEPTPIGPMGITDVVPSHCLRPEFRNEVISSLLRQVLHHPQDTKDYLDIEINTKKRLHDFQPILGSSISPKFFEGHSPATKKVRRTTTDASGYGGRNFEVDFESRGVIATAVVTTVQDSATSAQYSFHQAEQWSTRFDELLFFKGQHGHCCVPHHFPENPLLAQWIKRQRSQYKLKKQGQHSTLSDERERTLTDVGFVWDSHAAAWMEKFNELVQFKQRYGHCRVTLSDETFSKLGVWVKTQRRNYRRLSWNKSLNEGKTSSTRETRLTTLSPERIGLLNSLGFDWDPRNQS